MSRLVEAMIRMMRTDSRYWSGQPWKSHEFTIRELAEKVVALTGSTSTITYLPLLTMTPTTPTQYFPGQDHA
jgi:UDP-glucuronate decarboxylase